MSKKKVTGEDGKQHNIKEKKPFYKKWWFIAIMVLLVIGALLGALQGLFGSGEEEQVDAEDPETEEVVESEEIEEEPEEEPEEEVEEEPKEEVEEEPEEEQTDEEEKRIAVIEKKVIDIIEEDLIEEDFTEIEVNKIIINKNTGLDDGSYIVLPHLKWNVQNKEKMTRTMLEYYSNTIAIKLAEESDISEITVFWEVPYHKEGENIAKFMYERVDENNQGIAQIDNWYDPIISE